jgi:quinol monooxygenase YgiN
MDMRKYGLHGSLQAKKGEGQALADILLQAAELVRGAKGCHAYFVSLDEKTPDAVWVTEVWDDKESHDESLKAPEIRALIGQAMPMLAEMPAGGQTLQVLGGVIGK